MKKITVLLLTGILAASLSACGNSSKSQTAETEESQETVTAEMAVDSEEDNENSDGEESKKTPEETEDNTTDADSEETVSSTETAEQTSGSNILIAYFSVMETDGVDTVSSASRVVADGEVMGNNEYIAKTIQKATGGDLFQIQTVQEYPTTHDPLLEFAYNEKAEDARPELSSQIENLDQYDVIFLGYPNWNADLPMPLYTFLEQYDFSGKTIIPFTSHGGSGFSGTVQTISDLQPGAEVSSNGLSVSRNDVADSEQEVTEWVNNLGL